MTGKVLDPARLADELGIADGFTVGIGGWGSRRKPMALLRAIVLSGAKNLTVVSFGGRMSEFCAPRARRPK